MYTDGKGTCSNKKSDKYNHEVYEDGWCWKYLVNGGYPYQYFISYSAKNSFNADVISTNYYDWSDEYDSLKYYGTDSSKFDSARSGWKKQDIRF